MPLRTWGVVGGGGEAAVTCRGCSQAARSRALVPAPCLSGAVTDFRAGQASRAGRDRTIQVITKENTLETVALTGLDNSHDGRAKLTRIRPRAAAANNYYRRRLKNLSPLKNQAHPVFETWIVPSFSVDVETNSGA